MNRIPGFTAEASIPQSAANFAAGRVSAASFNARGAVSPALPSCHACIPECLRVCGVEGIRSAGCQHCMHTCFGFCV
jgi:hypothetical protein